MTHRNLHDFLLFPERTTSYHTPLMSKVKSESDFSVPSLRKLGKREPKQRKGKFPRSIRESSLFCAGLDQFPSNTSYALRRVTQNSPKQSSSGMERCIDQCMLGRTFQFLWAFSRMLEIHLYAMIDLFLSISLGSGCHKHVNTAPIYIWYFSLDHHVYPQREKNAFRLESAVLTGLFFEKLAPFPGKKNSKWREFRWHFFVSE